MTGYSQYQRSIILNAISEAQAALNTAQPDETERGGWTKRAYEKGLVKLAGSRAEVQIQAVKRAIEYGGSVTRAEVFGLGGTSHLRAPAESPVPRDVSSGLPLARQILMTSRSGMAS